jgi:Xaa-Pro aminopeptidase
MARVQNMMHDHQVDALVIVGGGSPGGMGAIRYLSNAHLWGGSGYVILGRNDPDPWLLAWSSYQAVWSRNESTTRPERVISPDDVLLSTAELALNYAGAKGRVGMVNMGKMMSVGEHARFAKLLAGHELVELTGPYNELRQIKSPWELEAIQEGGAILYASLNVFREHAYVGASYWEVCAQTEAFVKAQGSFWGRTKLSLDLTPYTVPTAKGLKMGKDDVINFEIVYESPWGYWLELTTVFTFGALPDEPRKLLDGYLAAVEASALAARAGNTFRDVSDANDRTLRELGFPVVGKHTPDCHSTGLDGSDGPNSIAAPDFLLKPNMVLSFHPGTVLENDRGFLVSDNFLVTPEGAVRLSPHTAGRYHIDLDG